MRPGRPGRCAPGQPAACAAGGRHGLAAPEGPSGPCAPGLHSPRMSAPTSPCPSSGAGRRPRPGCLAAASTAEKNAALLAAADLLRRARAARSSPPTPSTSTPPRPTGWRPVRSTACASPRPASRAWPTGLREVAALPDPVGEVLDGWRRPNGLQIERVRVPLGVVAIIYENRPNVTSDAAGHLPEVGQRRAAARVRPPRCARTSPSPTCCATASPRPGSPPTRACSSTTCATRPRSS